MKVIVRTTHAQGSRQACEDEQVHVLEPLATLNRLLRLHQCLWASFSANLESRYEVTVHEFRVLMMAGQLGETASHEIADNTGMAVMAISRTVVALEKRGLIKRTVDSENRRRKPIKLTAKGQKTVEDLMPTTNLVAEYLFDSLRLDEMLSFDYCLQALTERVTLKDDDGESIFVKQTRA